MKEASVLERDYRLIGKGLDHRDLTRVERANLVTADGHDADRFIAAHQRRDDFAAIAEPLLAGARVGELGQDGLGHISHMNGLSIEQSPPGGGTRCGRKGRPDDVRGSARRRPVQRDIAQDVAIAALDRHGAGVDQVSRARDERVQDALQISRRPGNDLENLGGRRLPHQRFRQSRVAVPKSLEQASVLQSDLRLIGEPRHQVDLALAVRSGFLPFERKETDHVVATEERYAEPG